MKDYKTADSRLVNIFKSARDKWKQRALFKQQQLRALGIKIRDTTLSRDKWKAKAQQAQQDLARAQAILKDKDAEIQRLKKKSPPLESLKESSKLKNKSP